MNGLLFALLLLAPPAESPGGQAFQLGPGEYRWINLNVSRAPSDVEIRYEVLQGGPTVHAELLSVEDFRRFNRGKGRDPLAATRSAQVAGLHKMILAKGQYRVVIANEDGARTATVSLNVRVDSNPRAGTATELSPDRRLTVILVSFLFFVTTVSLAGWRLLRGIAAGTAPTDR